MGPGFYPATLTDPVTAKRSFLGFSSSESSSLFVTSSLLFRSKPYSPTFRLRRRHLLADGIEHYLELRIVLLLNGVELLGHVYAPVPFIGLFPRAAVIARFAPLWTFCGRLLAGVRSGHLGSE